MDCGAPGSSVHGILQNTGVGWHCLLQGSFPTQQLNPGILYCRQTLPSELPGKPQRLACCLGWESNPIQLLGRSLWSPLYHQCSALYPSKIFLSLLLNNPQLYLDMFTSWYSGRCGLNYLVLCLPNTYPYPFLYLFCLKNYLFNWQYCNLPESRSSACFMHPVYLYTLKERKHSIIINRMN